MIPVPSGAQVWLATGHTDMRRGFDGLALMVQEKLRPMALYSVRDRSFNSQINELAPRHFPHVASRIRRMDHGMGH